MKGPSVMSGRGLRRMAWWMMPPPVADRLRAARRRRREEAAVARREERIAERRASLLAGDPDLRMVETGSGEGPGRVVADFTVAQAREHNLRLVTEVLDEAGVSFFLVRGNSARRHVLGVHLRDRPALFRAMRARHDLSAVWAVKPGRGGSAATASAYVDGGLQSGIKSSLVVRFAEPLLSGSGRVVGGLDLGCDVEFWQDADQLVGRERAARLEQVRCQTPEPALAGALVAPRPNRVADVLPVSAQVPGQAVVGERVLPTFEPFTWTLTDEVTFPVDVVYTWVDGTDPRHAARRARYSDEAPHGLGANTSRYTSHDELRYSLRSLHMYAPFVRHVYVVTDDQVPAWLDPDAAGITVVDHRDIFADASALPTFNSHAIGARLHHIPGLSEHYLYLNDDVFLARLRQAEDYFYANGIAQVPFSPAQFGVGDVIPGEVAPNSAGKTVRSLLQADFGRGITQKFKHAPHPQIRSVLAELEERYAEPVARTTRTRFRSTEDVGFAATLHHHYALLTGRAVPGQTRMSYVDIAAPDMSQRLDRLQHKGGVDTFCLNDVDTPEHTREAIHAVVAEFLEERFPFRSPWERPDA
ncbi:stealth family protein [Serinicoccus chungangensis]|uniref:stealth family protein n=1 Tax=Serinicoccus chungangensis TaxID=767452 RepID=UPI001EE8F6B1|nr:stealth family protein [Serinicoccus chungangensis]